MKPTPATPDARNRLPAWLLVGAPLVTLLVSNADVLLLARDNPRIATEQLALALGTTIPLSVLACGLTVWLLLRLRREIDWRADSQHNLREALSDRGAALTDLEQALDRERLLRRELDHRVRNNLSALLGLVGLYEESDATSADVVRSLRAKIVTLREVYGLISATQGEGIELSELIRVVVAGTVGGEPQPGIAVEGPSVRLTSREANAFAMIIQELVTNAAKHGALRHQGGTIRVTWESTIRAAQARVALRWVESPAEGPVPATPPGAGGLGLLLIEGFAKSDLRGGVWFRREPGRWTVELVANLKVPGESRVHPPVLKEAAA